MAAIYHIIRLELQKTCLGPVVNSHKPNFLPICRSKNKQVPKNFDNCFFENHKTNLGDVQHVLMTSLKCFFTRSETG